jgi:hypothetical protein
MKSWGPEKAFTTSMRLGRGIILALQTVLPRNTSDEAANAHLARILGRSLACSALKNCSRVTAPYFYEL